MGPIGGPVNSEPLHEQSSCAINQHWSFVSNVEVDWKLVRSVVKHWNPSRFIKFTSMYTHNLIRSIFLDMLCQKYLRRWAIYKRRARMSHVPPILLLRVSIIPVYPSLGRVTTNWPVILLCWRSVVHTSCVVQTRVRNWQVLIFKTICLLFDHCTQMNGFN